MELEKELELLKERNKRVEADKAWETSFFRKAAIAVLTYTVASVVMYSIEIQKFFLNALVPTAGYLLSAQSLPFLKKWWIKAVFKKNQK